MCVRLLILEERLFDYIRDLGIYLSLDNTSLVSRSIGDWVPNKGFYPSVYIHVPSQGAIAMGMLRLGVPNLIYI